MDRVRMHGARPWPPRASAFTQRFWEALARGEFTSTCCEACGRPSFPPKPFCPHCWSHDVRWVPLAPRGRVYSSTVIHAAPQVFVHEAPYRVAVVDLEAGVRLATRLIGANDFAIGHAVDLVVLDYDDGALFAARPSP